MIIFVAYRNIISDDQGYNIVANYEGMMFEMRSHHKDLRSFISTSELFNISQTFGRETTNQVIIDEINRLHDQFFEEV